MVKTKTHDKQVRYVAAKLPRAETQLAFELQSCGSSGKFFFNQYGYRHVAPNARSENGKPIFLIEDLPRQHDHGRKGGPEFDKEVGKAAAGRRRQTAYERVGSDEFVDFYRVRSIVRLKEDETNKPRFVFVD